MSESCLIEEKTLKVKKSLCKNFTLAAIDRGCSLTKVLFATEADEDHFTFHFALFLNKDFAEGLHYLKDQGAVLASKDGKLHVTGVGCDKYRGLIKDIVGLDTEFINEFLTQGRGSHWLIKNFADEDICHPPVTIDKSLFHKFERPESFKKMLDSLNDAFKDKEASNSKFPAILCFMGSGAGAFKIEDNGETSLLGGVSFGGKSFLGLAQLLVGTNNYDEIVDLASRGTRKNCDTQVRDILLDDPNSPYGRYPPSFPTFSFGKASDQPKTISDFKREDLANSLVASFCLNIYTNVVGGFARSHGISNIYFGGNFFRHEQVRKELILMDELYATGREKVTNLQFLKTGHTGALGAMISSNEDMAQYLKYMKQ